MPKTKDGHTEAIWARIDAVVVLILDNDRYLQTRRTDELCQVVVEKFEISNEQAYRYIRSARAEVRKLGRENKKAAFEKANRRNEHLWNKSKINDIKLALEINKEYTKLNDLYPDQKVKTENVNYEFDPGKFTEHGLERLQRGDDIKNVLLDPKSVKQEND